MTSNKVFVVGVGMTKFEKPGRRDWDYPEMTRESVDAAVADAGVGYDVVQQAAVGYMYADSCAGQRAVYQQGLTGIPIYNVNNNCATGSTALFLVRQLIQAGVIECGLAVGFEMMASGSLKGHWPGRANPLGLHSDALTEIYPSSPTDVPAPWLFGSAGREHMERYGSTPEHFAMVAEKNHRHSAANPNAQFQDVYTLDEVLAAPMIHDPLTKLQCSPTSEGSAAAVLMSEAAVRRFGLQDRAVEVVGQAMVTDTAGTLESRSAIQLAGAEMTRQAAGLAYEQSGISPEDVDVVELHDCFSTNEVITYEGLGLAPEGKGHLLLDEGLTTYGGQWVVNPSGGLISKGHPIGATGLAQCAELSWQLRGLAGARQVDGAAVGLQHNLGLGGAAVVTIYRGPV